MANKLVSSAWPETVPSLASQVSVFYWLYAYILLHYTSGFEL